jgi:hypothetical protein
VGRADRVIYRIDEAERVVRVVRIDNRAGVNRTRVPIADA